MARTAPFTGLRAWLIHKLVANYWALPAVAIVVAPMLAGFGLWLDRQGLARWIHDNGLTPVASADTAQDLAITAVGMDAAFITLYFSIVLIVLTLAAGNLGMRLVDRWLDKRLVRFSMAGLAFCLVDALVVLMAIDPKAEIVTLPLFSIGVMVVLQLINLAMLGVAAHDLGRTMFVDRSIANLGKEAGGGGVPVIAGIAREGEWPHRIDAPREGYVQGIDLDDLAKRLSGKGRVHFCVAPGQHILAGEPLMLMEAAPEDEGKLLRAIAIGAFRSNVESTVYQVRLLVEVGARALSPGINDFYTALACADRLIWAMAEQADLWIDEGKTPLYAEHPDFEIPGQDFRGLFEDPLQAFRQAAAPYPAVSIRMIDNYGRFCRLEKPSPTCKDFVATLAGDIARHAIARAEDDRDRADIGKALERAMEDRC